MHTNIDIMSSTTKTKTYLMDLLGHSLKLLLFGTLLVNALDLIHLLLEESSNRRRTAQASIAHQPVPLRDLLL